MTFRNFDAPAAPQAVSIAWEVITRPDEDANAEGPEARDDGFWPSLDKDDPGYVGEENRDAFADHMQAAQDRLEEFETDAWEYVGVMARATIAIPIGGGSFASYVLESPGLWGVESDSSPEYLAEVFAGERAALEEALRALARHTLAPLLTAASTLAGCMDEALTQHIYDEDNGDEVPEDCSYTAAVAEVRAQLGETD